MSILNQSPFTTYQYYKHLHEIKCHKCQQINQNHLLRYRTYLLPNKAIIPTRNYYYSVCTHCGYYFEVEDELLLMKLLQAARKIKATTYDNNSFEEHLQVQEFDLENTIKFHLKMLK